MSKEPLIPQLQEGVDFSQWKQRMVNLFTKKKLLAVVGIDFRGDFLQSFKEPTTAKEVERSILARAFILDFPAIR
jgi:hypothetical protein